jgi:protein gp37
MKDTKIRWAGATLNVGIGCVAVSPGCDNCYAEKLVGKRAGMPGWPASFEEGIWKPQKLADVAKWARAGARRIFVNSLSDAHWNRWTTDQIDQLYDGLLAYPMHDYLVLTKRPKEMARFFCGSDATRDNTGLGSDGYLARRGLTEVPACLWLGTTIENDRYTFRADWLRRIPVPVRFLSCEPLLGPLPSLDLTGLSWIIEGGESGNGTRNFRPMDWDWARDLRDRCDAAGVAFYHKQGSGVRTEMFQELDGVRYEQYPLPHPGLGLPREIGIYTDADPDDPAPIEQGALL